MGKNGTHPFFLIIPDIFLDKHFKKKYYMAIKKGDFLTGVVGDYKFTVVNGKQVVSSRVKAGTMKQTEPTKRASGNFGTASALCKHFRNLNQSLISGLSDAKMSKRLNGRFTTILNDYRDTETYLYDFSEQSFKSLQGFELNETSPVRKRMLMLPEIKHDNRLLTLAFPESDQTISLKFPAKSHVCEMIASVAMFDLKKCTKAPAVETQQKMIEKKNPIISDFKFEFEVPPGCLCVVSLFLKYYTVLDIRGTMLNTKKFSPAAICGAIITPGTNEGYDTSNWLEMNKIQISQTGQ